MYERTRSLVEEEGEEEEEEEVEEEEEEEERVLEQCANPLVLRISAISVIEDLVLQFYIKEIYIKKLTS